MRSLMEARCMNGHDFAWQVGTPIMCRKCGKLPRTVAKALQPIRDPPGEKAYFPIAEETSPAQQTTSEKKEVQL